MDPDAEGRVELDGRPFDLAETLRRNALWGADPTLRFRGEEAWTAFRAASGAVTVRYVARGTKVHVLAWGPGAGEAVERAPEHLGALDPSWSYESDHPVVGPLLRRCRGLRFGRTGRALERAVPVVLGQKVTSAAASRSWRELIHRYGERAPGPERLWLPPSAERLAELAYFDLHELNVERRRAETILRLARRARWLEALAELPPERAGERLRALPGMGPWSAALFVSAVHGDPDAVPVGDYHLPDVVTHALTGAPRGDDARMLQLLEPFRPFRGRALAALVRGAPPPPRFGPKLPVRDIRRS